jgi:allophanate hydrolase subunit 2
VPTKAIRELLETTDLGFEYQLADRLKIGTVGELRRRMSSAEFETWKVFHAMRNQQIELAQAKGG